jgi:bifunctional enzyme CysN/CysC
MVPGRSYAFRIGTQSMGSGSITAIKYKMDVNSGAHLAAPNAPDMR